MRLLSDTEPGQLTLLAALQISEGESRLKQQQNLYETVRADRNVYSKNLVQAQDEIQELKRKFKIMVRAHHPSSVFTPALDAAW